MTSDCRCEPKHFRTTAQENQTTHQDDNVKQFRNSKPHLRLGAATGSCSESSAPSSAFSAFKVFFETRTAHFTRSEPSVVQLRQLLLLLDQTTRLRRTGFRRSGTLATRRDRMHRRRSRRPRLEA